MSISLIKSMLLNKIQGKTKPETTVEKPFANSNTPLRPMRYGAAIDFSGFEASLLIAQSKDTLFNMTNAQTTVTAYGRYIDDFYTIRRFYLGDMQNNEAPFLQVTSDLDTIRDMKIFSFLTEINPSSVEEWDLWDPRYGNESLISRKTIMWQDQYEYYRMWGGDAEFVSPLVYNETISVGDNNPQHVLKKTMLFSRMLNDTINEYLMLSVCNSNGTLWVEAYVGLPINVNELTIY